MEKRMKRANERLENARQYVASYVVPKPQSKQKNVAEPAKVIHEPAQIVSRFDSAEIMKLEKGHFFIVLTIGHRKQQLNKRFKSVTKAEEWVATHQYERL